MCNVRIRPHYRDGDVMRTRRVFRYNVRVMAHNGDMFEIKLYAHDTRDAQRMARDAIAFDGDAMIIVTID